MALGHLMKPLFSDPFSGIENYQDIEYCLSNNGFGHLIVTLPIHGAFVFLTITSR